jgi:hypothetical protein
LEQRLPNELRYLVSPETGNGVALSPRGQATSQKRYACDKKLQKIQVALFEVCARSLSERQCCRKSFVVKKCLACGKEIL